MTIQLTLQYFIFLLQYGASELQGIAVCYTLYKMTIQNNYSADSSDIEHTPAAAAELWDGYD